MTDLNAKHICYLTEEAIEAISLLQDAGIMDRDLAIAVLERLWPETQIYALPDGEEAYGEIN